MTSALHNIKPNKNGLWWNIRCLLTEAGHWVPC